MGYRKWAEGGWWIGDGGDPRWVADIQVFSYRHRYWRTCGSSAPASTNGRSVEVGVTRSCEVVAREEVGRI